jgi:hypothetical protein
MVKVDGFSLAFHPEKDLPSKSDIHPSLLSFLESKTGRKEDN